MDFLRTPLSPERIVKELKTFFEKNGGFTHFSEELPGGFRLASFLVPMQHKRLEGISLLVCIHYGKQKGSFGLRFTQRLCALIPGSPKAADEAALSHASVERIVAIEYPNLNDPENELAVITEPLPGVERAVYFYRDGSFSVEDDVQG